MKKTRILSILIPIVMLAGLIINTSLAYQPVAGTKFTPDRSSLTIQDGNPGLTYNSYNNFSYANTGGTMDERQFTWATVNPPENGDPDYAKSWDGPFHEGDVVLVRVLFHNNGEDPYDGSGNSPVKGPSPAQSVSVGVDTSDPFHPTGFIYSPDNSYKDSNGDIIKYQNGDYISKLDTSGTVNSTAKTASDNVVFNTTDNLNLELTPQAVLYMSYDINDDGIYEIFTKNKNGNPGYQQITSTAQIPIPVETTQLNGSSVSEEVTKNLNVNFNISTVDQQAWLKFDSHPGCFRYLGRAYFKAIVHVPPTQNLCKSANISVTQNSCSQIKKKEFQITLAFDDNTNLPTIRYITFDSKDKNAILEFPQPGGKNKIVKMSGEATSFHHTEQMTATTPILRGVYTGTSELTATYTDEKGTPIKGVKVITQSDGTSSTQAVPYSPGETPICTVKIAPCGDCGSICVSHNQIIQTGTYGEFSATALDTNKNNWPESITYSVSGGDGKFYTKTDLDINKDGTVSDEEIKAKIKQDFPNSNPQKNTSTYENFLSQINLKDAADVLSLLGKTLSDTNIYQYTGELQFTQSIKTAIPKNMEMELYKVPEPIPPKGNVDPMEKQIKTGNPAEQPAEQPNKYFHNDVFLAFTINKNLTTPSSTESKTINTDVTTTIPTNIKSVIKDYSTSPPLGSDKSDSLPKTAEPAKFIYNPPVTVAAGEKVWFYADKEGTGVIHVKANNTNNTNCEKSFNIIKAPTPEKCAKLNLNFKETTPPSILNPETAFVGTARKLNLEVLSGLGKSYPSTIKWSDSTGGKIVFPSGTQVTTGGQTETINGVEKQTTVYTTKYPPPTGDIVFFDSKTEGTIKAEVVGEENICFDSVKTVKPITPPATPVCKSLTYTVYDSAGNKIGDTTNLSHLAGPDIFKIKTDIVYDPEKVGGKQVTYDAVSRDIVPVIYGYFAPETEVELPYIGRMILPPSDLSKWSSKLEKIDVNTAVYFMANPNRRALAPGVYKDAIRIKDSDSGTIECSKSLGLTVYKPEVCQNIIVKPGQSEFNPTKLTNVFIDETASNFGGYKGDYKFTTVARDQAFLYSSKAEAEAAIAAGKTSGITSLGKSELTLSKIKATKEGIYIFVPSTETKEVVLQITAADPAQKGCTAILKYTPPVTPKKPCGTITLLKEVPASAPNLVRLYLAPSPTSNFGDYSGKFKFNLTTTESNVTLFPTTNTGSGGGLTQDVTKENALAGIYLYPNDTTKNWKVTVEASEESPTTCKSENGQTYTPPPVTPVCKDLTITKPSKWVFDTEDAKDSETQDFAVSVTMDPATTPYTVQWSVSGSDPLTHFDYAETSPSASNQTSSTNILNHISTDVKSVTAKVKNSDVSSCQKTINLETTGETPPSINKFVKKGALDEDDPEDLKKGEKWDDLINVSGQENSLENKNSSPDRYVTYKVVFKSGSTQSAKIREEEMMKDGKINGFIKGEPKIREGSLDFKFLVIKVGNDEIYDDNDFDDYTCEYDKDDKLESSNHPCITVEDGDEDTDWDNIVDAFSSGEDLIFNNLDNDKISIYYEMENNTSLRPETCAKLNPATNGCGEEFDNTASFDANYNEIDGNEWTHSDESDEDSAKVIAVCPYILTRTSGDVFFNKPLETGTDVAYCSPQKNIVGPIIIPIPKEKLETPSTGPDGNIRTPTLSLPSHDICKFSNVPGGENMPLEYQNPLKNFSSTICEMKADVAEWWLVQNVKSQIIANVEKISRWSTANTGTDLVSATQSNGLFVWDGTDVTLNTDLTIGNDTTGNLPASRTYIIKNGDLIINKNITYGTADYSNPKSVPSAAFIVINGDIIVGKDVTELAGTYIAVNDADNANKGLFTSPNDSNGQPEMSYNQLTVTGSLIGDVSELFGNRKFVGDISSDEGSVTIKYSENFLLNTPPGLSELMNINQLEVAY